MENEAKKKIIELIDYFSVEFKKHNITKKDIEKEVRAVKKSE